jgi:hypothetical protein
MRSTGFWDVTPWYLVEIYRRFTEPTVSIFGVEKKPSKKKQAAF